MELILPALVVLPLFGALTAWWLETVRPGGAWWSAWATVLLQAVLVALLWGGADSGGPGVRFAAAWVPSLGVEFALHADPLAATMLALTALLSVAAVAVSARHTEGAGLFMFCVLATVAGANGVFLAADLFLLVLCWEAMIIPMFLLIARFGHERRLRAALIFFLYTQSAGLLLAAAVMGLAVGHYQLHGVWTFDYASLAASVARLPAWAPWLLGGFVAAFAVKLPLFPLHSWLPDAHTQAPTAGSVLLAGVLLKTGGYGFIRFVWSLFPDAVGAFVPVLVVLAVAGILYGGLLAFGQHDAKRLVAYSSVSHMGFVLLGVAAATPLALQGAVVMMVAHGLVTAALFMVTGRLQEDAGSRRLAGLGGLQGRVPRLSGLALYFTAATIGLPGLAVFAGEFMVLVGTFQVRPGAALAAALGLFLSVLYGLRWFQGAFHGPAGSSHACHTDLQGSPLWVLALLALATLAVGLYPQGVFPGPEAVTLLSGGGVQ